MPNDLAIDEVIESLKRARAASQHADREGFAREAHAFMRPDGEWIPLIGGVEGRTYTGPEGAVAFFDDFHSAFEVRYGEAEYKRFGERVVVELTTMHMRGRHSNVAVERELGVVYEMEDGRLRRAFAYDSHPDALAKAEDLHAQA